MFCLVVCCVVIRIVVFFIELVLVSIFFCFFVVECVGKSFFDYFKCYENLMKYDIILNRWVMNEMCKNSCL